MILKRDPFRSSHQEMDCSRGIEILANEVPDCRVAVLARIDRSADQRFLKPA